MKFPCVTLFLQAILFIIIIIIIIIIITFLLLFVYRISNLSLRTAASYQVYSGKKALSAGSYFTLKIDRSGSTFILKRKQ